MMKSVLLNSCVTFLGMVVSVMQISQAWPLYGNSVFNQMAMDRKKDSLLPPLPQNDEKQMPDVFGDPDLYPIRKNTTTIHSCNMFGKFNTM